MDSNIDSTSRGNLVGPLPTHTIVSSTLTVVDRVRIRLLLRSVFFVIISIIHHVLFLQVVSAL